MKPTPDPLSRCCGDPADCHTAHLYCFNRTPKEADVDAMRKFEAAQQQDKIETPEQRKAFDVAFDAAASAAQRTLFSNDLQEAIDQAEKAVENQVMLPTWAQEALDGAEKEIEQQGSHLPVSSKARKETPICTGVLDYFPKALAEVARLSKSGNDKHNPGQPLHWDREKSTDHADCIVRHMIDRGTLDEFGFLHEVSVAWRALAQLEVALEKGPRK
jgi:hypothetical protein